MLDEELEEFDFESFAVLEMKAYSLAKKYNLIPHPENSPAERQLWAAVVIQAIEDLFYLPRARKPKPIDLVNCKRIRASAYNFLFGDSPLITKYRKFIFLSAGLDIEVGPERLRQQAEKFEAVHRVTQ